MRQNDENSANWQKKKNLGTSASKKEQLNLSKLVWIYRKLNSPHLLIEDNKKWYMTSTYFGRIQLFALQIPCEKSKR